MLVPVTTCGERLIEIVARGEAVDRSVLVDLFAPGFLHGVPVEAVEGLLAQLRSEGLDLTDVEANGSSFAAVFTGLDGAVMLRGLHGSAEIKGRIVAAVFTPVPDASWSWTAHADEIRGCDRSDPILATVDALARSFRDEHRVPALALSVTHAGTVVHEQRLGTRTLSEPEPLGEHERFRLGSITKVVTALGVLRLVQECALDLDDPVSDHLRSVEVRPSATTDAPITVRHVLAHSAGFPRSAGDPAAATFVEMVAGSVQAAAPPGTRKLYSNLGFGLLGQLLTDVTGVAYATFLRDEVLEPTGMLDGSIDPDGASVSWAGTDGVADVLFEVDPQRVADEAAGALCGSLRDLRALGSMILADGEGLLDPQLLAAALAPASAPDPDGGPRSGLGFALTEVGGHRTVWHNGGLSGWEAAWYVVPDRGLVVVAAANRFTGSLDHLVRSVIMDGLEN